MFSSPFPDNISFFCGQQSSVVDSPLHPQEKAIAVEFGSEKRRAEFLLGRSCAHKALSKLKLETEPILRNRKTREPCWPETVCGSITHSEGWAAAAVGFANDISGIGIDLESLSRNVDYKISRHVCVESELKWLESMPQEQANLMLRIIFSAKESIFKCLYPVSKTYLYFKDAVITINENKKKFSFTLSKACAEITPAGFRHSGKYCIKNKMLLTAILIPKISNNS